ncbi:MAG: glycosyltransferase family 4 protein [Rhodothermales bacterium]|nr:glycosyltransferase family 4 protein [Rhodothermales bacterium]
MRVALITSMKFGLTQFILRDVTGLMARGTDVRLFALLRGPGLYEPAADWPVTVASRWRAVSSLLSLWVKRPVSMSALAGHALRSGSLRDLAVAAQFASGVGRTDVIFAYFGDHKLFVGYYLHRILGLPLVVTVRAYELYRNPNEALFRDALAACSSVLTITEHNASVLERRFGVDPDKIQIIRQMVDLDLYAPRDVVKILIVAYFAEKKGHEVLLRALAMLDDPDVELWVVGDVNPSIVPVDVRSIADQIGVSDRVAFFGAQSGVALRSLYREADIFCLPSQPDRTGDHEGFPNVIAEAMAFGKPIVATRHAGIPEAVNRVLVEEGDAESLAEALSELINSAVLRRELGLENRTRAVEMFSHRNTDALFNALEVVAGGYRQAGS